MAKLVECVPNFSEGRRPEVIHQVLDVISEVPGVSLLDWTMDASHNRAVVTFLGGPEAIEEAAFQAVRKASTLIDLTQHQGEHPRMGATDVVPFVPVSGVTIAECVAMAKRVGQRIGEELEIPVFLYEKAASRKDRRNLADVRRGEFEGLRDAIPSDPSRRPDFGPDHVHPTAGATAVGARVFLVAYNVNLNTRDVGVASRIADAVRQRTGGFRYVKALGLELADKGCVQVSMNLTDYRKSAVHRVFQVIEREARRYGVGVMESEIVGLIPNEALIMAAEDALCLGENWSREQIVESKLLSLASSPEQTVGPFLDELAAKTEAPGGGSVAALAGALGAALTTMVCQFTIGKRKFSQVRPEMEEILVSSESLRKDLTELISRDAEAFDRVMAASKMPNESEEEAGARSKAIQEAYRGAVAVPMQTLRHALDVLDLATRAAASGNPNLLSDAGVGGLQAATAARGAFYNVIINLAGFEDEAERKSLAVEAAGLMAEVDQRAGELQADLTRRLAEASSIPESWLQADGETV